MQDLHIKKLKIDNYKSLKDSEIELKEGLNIIIGKNGAGKSNFLEFLNNYATVSPQNLMRAININFSISYEYTYLKKKQVISYKIERKRTIANRIVQYTYDLTLHKSEDKPNSKDNNEVILRGVQVDDYIHFEDNKTLYDEFVSLRYIQYSLVSFITPPEIAWVSKPSKIVIDRYFDNLTSIDEISKLSFLKKLQFEIEFENFANSIREDSTTEMMKEKLTTFLSNYLNETLINSILYRYTNIKEIRFNPNINIYKTEQTIIIDNLYIDFNIDNYWLPWSYLSDGTKRIFYLLSEALSFDDIDCILLVEEPELGIHPHQLYKIMDFLKEQSRHKQIIISTHSPLVLDVLEEKELDKIIIAKYDNGTKFKHLSDEEISKAKRYMNEVGELSYYWLHSDLEK